MKKAFTLIELLAAIILLAVIALIATPIILKVIENAKEKADFESARAIVNGGRLYYTESMLDNDKQIKIDNLDDIYNDLILNNKPQFGQLYVNNKGNIAMAVIINNKCYKKGFMGNIEKTEVSNCDLGYVGIDETPPTISQEVISSIINENGWYKEDIYIKVNIEDSQSGVLGYKRCISQIECEPNEDIHTNNNIIVTTESASNYVCVIGVDKYGNESEKNCEIYKLDKTNPILSGISDISVNIGENIDLLDGIEMFDSLSGVEENIQINPNTVDTTITGITQVNYTLYDKAGNSHSVVRNIVVDAEAPTIIYEVLNNAINSNGWANSDFYIKAIITDNSNTGIKTSKSCSSTTSSECTPIAEFTGNEKTFYVSTEGLNRLCIEVTDNNDKTTKLCSDIYKLDKTAPDIILSTSPLYNNQINAILTCTDTLSSVDSYYFSIDGNTYINNGLNNEYLFDNLTSGNSYNIYGKCGNKSGLFSTTTKNLSTNYCWKEREVYYRYSLSSWTLLSTGTTIHPVNEAGYTSYSFDSTTGKITLSGYQGTKTYKIGSNATYEYYYERGDGSLGARVIKTTSKDITISMYGNPIIKTAIPVEDNIVTYSLQGWQKESEGTASVAVIGGYTTYSFDSATGAITLSGNQNSSNVTPGASATYEYYFQGSDGSLGARVIKVFSDRITVTIYKNPVVSTTIPNTGVITIYKLSNWNLEETHQFSLAFVDGYTAYSLDGRTGKITLTGYQNKGTILPGSNATYEFYYERSDGSLGARVIKVSSAYITISNYSNAIITENKEVSGSNMVCDPNSDAYPENGLLNDYYYELIR